MTVTIEVAEARRREVQRVVRLLEEEGFRLIRHKGSIRYYGKEDWPNLIRVDFHGAREVPKGTCHAILKSAGIHKP